MSPKPNRLLQFTITYIYSTLHQFLSIVFQLLYVQTHTHTHGQTKLKTIPALPAQLDGMQVINANKLKALWPQKDTTQQSKMLANSIDELAKQLKSLPTVL